MPVCESALGYPQQSDLSVFAEGEGLPWSSGLPVAVLAGSGKAARGLKRREAMVFTAVIDLEKISKRLGLPEAGVVAVIELLDQGNTVPFITRYRRDQTGGLDELQVRAVAAAIARARQLADRKQTILRTIEGQGRLTPELQQQIETVENPKVLEDIYLPFKPRRLSLAEQAKQRRLEPLAKEILAGDSQAATPEIRAADFVDADVGVATVADALLGVGHIIADWFSERPDLRQRLRKLLFAEGRLRSQRIETPGKPQSKAAKHFRDYFEFDEQVQKVPPHRVLAINRGERAKVLRVRIEGPVETIQSIADELLVPADHPHAELLRACCRDALTRLILPSLEREVRREMTDASEEHAIAVFARNLRNLLLQPPVNGRIVLAIDPGFKSGCKAVVLDACGKPLAHEILHIIGKADQRAAAAARIVELVREHGCNVIAVGNGTAGREVESLLAELVAGELQEQKVAYVFVNEAGASVYSTSQYAREELPEFEAAFRGAVSIGRRLLDPLSELVKIEPANIGVGLYQHDVKARHLHASLDEVVEGCVNFVGVDVNTASPALLRYVAGLNQAVARGIVDWRSAKGAFTSREQFREVPGFGDAAYVQAVGFLKIADGVNPLDATWIHPESYPVAERLLEKIGHAASDLGDREKQKDIATAINAIDRVAVADELGVGRLLLADIVEQFKRPGRDPREDLPEPLFKQGVLKFEDLEVGMELRGSVLNVVDFGAFIDIGLHDSGLVHISQLSSGFIRDPHAAVVVGQAVRVWVMELDKTRRRVALTMINPKAKRRPADQGPVRPRNGRKGSDQPAKPMQQKADGSPRPAGDRRERRRPRGGERRREQPRGPRVYSSSRGREPAKPISDEMKTGREPLRTFGDLKQFFDAHNESGDVPTGKSRKRGNKPKPSKPVDAEPSLDQVDPGSDQAAAAAEAGHETLAGHSGESPKDPSVATLKAEPATETVSEVAPASSVLGTGEPDGPPVAPASEPSASSPEAAASEKPETD